MLLNDGSEHLNEMVRQHIDWKKTHTVQNKSEVNGCLVIFIRKTSFIWNWIRETLEHKKKAWWARGKGATFFSHREYFIPRILSNVFDFSRNTWSSVEFQLFFEWHNNQVHLIILLQIIDHSISELKFDSYFYQKSDFHWLKVIFFVYFYFDDFL